ncbi:hypothetical protein SORBI_3001G327200 [Sorghum bicolor]|uniref:Uncharacterized protein n=1 Tax=Sorghum bicolor TaxID=4558 RepID=A0A1Z5S8S5_SORBI|nr:hypothetical protein SORBI_3001G327200 [Sorghum bicolor]
MKTTTTSPTVLLTIALLCDAARQLPATEGSVVENQEAPATATTAYTTMPERAWSKTTAMAWTQQLPSGPSPRGPGH